MPGVGPIRDPLPDPPLEAGGVVRPHADVLVHVEDRRLRPRDALELDQPLDQRELGVAGGEHGMGPPTLGDGVAQGVGGLPRRLIGQGGGITVDDDGHGSHPEPLRPRGLALAHGGTDGSVSETAK